MNFILFFFFLDKKAYTDGHTIASHTYHHLNLLKLSDYEVYREITKTNRDIQALTGETPKYLRPPYGNSNEKIRKQNNMITILWSVDPEDWKYKNTDKIYQTIVHQAYDGAIILLHDLYTTSIDAALKAMDQLQKEGYAFVTIDEMIVLRGNTIDSSKNYYQFKKSN